MRLSNKQIESIISALTPYIGNEQAELRLYGSRVHDELKGGDIDLLLLVEQSAVTTALYEQKHYILAAIKKLLGDQKIDLLITDRKKVNEDSFLKMIEPTSQCLYIWHGDH